MQIDRMAYLCYFIIRMKSTFCRKVVESFKSKMKEIIEIIAKGAKLLILQALRLTFSSIYSGIWRLPGQLSRSLEGSFRLSWSKVSRREQAKNFLNNTLKTIWCLIYEKWYLARPCKRSAKNSTFIILLNPFLRWLHWVEKHWHLSFHIMSLQNLVIDLHVSSRVV